MDTYHIQLKKVNWHTVLLYAFIVILCWLLFRSCNKNPLPPQVITSEQLRDTIRIVDSETQRIRDSFNLVLYIRQVQDDKNYIAYIKALNENAVLFNENEMLSKYVPDSCKELQAGWIHKFTQLKVASNKKDFEANNTIVGLQGTISTQKSFLAAKDTAYSKMKAIADTCTSAVSQLEKYIKKIRPKREVSIGIEANSSYLTFKPTIGIGLGYRARNGLQFNAAVFLNKTVNLSIKKPLFKF